MRHKKLEKKYVVLIILILISLFLALVFTIVKSKNNLNPIEQSIKDTVLLISKVIYMPINYTKDTIKENKQKDNIYEKYQQQQVKIAGFNKLEAKQNDLEKQLKEMKGLLKLNETSLEYVYLNATVINRNVGYWYNTLTIDKGKTSGVKKDMAVMVEAGLIGKITKVSNFNSTVKLLTNNDAANSLSVKINIGDKYVFGILKGYNKENSTLIVEGISGNNNIPLGSEVITTGLSDNAPSGLLIGKVKKIRTDNFDLARILEVESAINFDDVNYVSVLKKKEDK
ncbi:MAG: rod shape-determining protein MreC [Bacilli bacterium]